MIATPTIVAILPLSIWYHLPISATSAAQRVPSRRPVLVNFITSRPPSFLPQEPVDVLNVAGTSTTTGGGGGGGGGGESAGVGAGAGAGAGVGVGFSPPIVKNTIRPIIITITTKAPPITTREGILYYLLSFFLVKDLKQFFYNGKLWCML